MARWGRYASQCLHTVHNHQSPRAILRGRAILDVCCPGLRSCILVVASNKKGASSCRHVPAACLAHSVRSGGTDRCRRTENCDCWARWRCSAAARRSAHLRARASTQASITAWTSLRLKSACTRHNTSRRCGLSSAAARGSGGHALSLSHPGVNVPGASVTLTLSGASEYKGLLLLAEVDGTPVTAWGTELPEGVQRHPHCKHGLTHDTYHVGGKLRDDIPWVVPDGLADGTEVVFKATVVRDYATWCVHLGRAALAPLPRA